MKLPELSCAHERGEAPYDAVVSDYLPISKGELVELMTTAINSRDTNIPNMVQCRLEKAVPGIECPRQIEGPVARKSNLVSRLFLREIAVGPTETFIPRFYRIINAG